MGRLNEKCAVAAVSSDTADVHATQLVFEFLLSLQHRGQQGSGIVAEGDTPGSIRFLRDLGYVNDVFSSGEKLLDFSATRAIGHNIYSTNGKRGSHPQPVVDRPLGFAFAHNGNISDTDALAQYLAVRNITIAGLNDSEMMAHTIASEIRSGYTLEEALTNVTPLFTGAYACTGLYDNCVFALRDSRGIRPLSMGRLKSAVLFASETCALEGVGAELIEEVKPGELIIAKGSDITRIQLAKSDPKLDIFELVYFARPDSVLCGQRVAEFRREFGKQLAKEHSPITDNHKNVVIIPVPDTSIPAAEGYADFYGLKHRQGIIKDRYSASGRSFIVGDGAERAKMLRRKHTFLPESVEGRDVILVDDSIVRGSTIKNLVLEAKRLGAQSVTCLIASPPVRFPDFYGIDTPSQDELSAVDKTVEEMRIEAGCDYLGFLSLDGMVKATGRPKSEFNLSPFNGVYPVSIGKHAEDIREPKSMEYIE